MSYPTLVWGAPSPPPQPSPLVFSNIDESEVTDVGARISWNVVPDAKGEVRYGTSSGNYTDSTPREEGYLGFHSQTIEGLSPGTQYFYVVWGQSAEGAERTSTEDSFTTESVAAPATTIYGPGIISDGLFNERIGHGNQAVGDYYFRAEQSSALESFTIYIIANGNTGYSNGDGGDLRFRLCADNGSGAPNTGAVLATATTLTPGNPASDDFPTVVFPSPYTTTAGTLYHIVCDNIDGSPTVNYSSLDLMYYAGTPYSPEQPRFPGNDFGYLVNYANGGWESRGAVTPVLDIEYANGQHQGMGYMESGIYGGNIQITGSTMLREQFTVSDGPITVTGFGVFLSRMNSGTSPLVVGLYTMAGSVLEQVNVAASSIAIDSGSLPADGGATLATGSFVSSHVLADNTGYYLRFSAASGTIYRSWTLRKGTNYGFTAGATFFAAGYGQKTTTGGSSWGAVRTSPNWAGDEDAMCYLTVA